MLFYLAFHMGLQKFNGIKVKELRLLIESKFQNFIQFSGMFSFNLWSLGFHEKFSSSSWVTIVFLKNNRIFRENATLDIISSNCVLRR